jgi:cobalt-precorrin 5A hydrolase
VPALFAAFDGIVAIVSLGAVVRLIAPHLGNKETDPAVVVIDEAGRFAIPVLSGHLGGANALAGTCHGARRDAGADHRIGRPRRRWPSTCSAANSAGPSKRRMPNWSAQRRGGQRRAGGAGPGGRQHGLVGATPTAAAAPAGEPGAFARLEDVDPDRFAAVLWISRARCRPTTPPAWPASGSSTGRRRHELRAAAAQRLIALGLGCDRGTPAATIAQAIAKRSPPAARARRRAPRWPASTSRPTSPACCRWPRPQRLAIVSTRPPNSPRRRAQPVGNGAPVHRHAVGLRSRGAARRRHRQDRC